MATWQDAIKFIKINDLSGFSLRQGTSDNQMLFKSLPDESIDDAISRAEQIMAFTEGRYILLEGYKGANQQRGKYSFSFQNSILPTVSGVQQAQPVMDENFINSRIAVAIEKVKAEYDKQDLERREKELKERMKEFEQDKSSVIGMVVEKIAPMIKGVAQRQTASLAVGTLGEAASEPIRPAREESAEQPEDAEVELSDDIVRNILRWQAVERELPQLLEVIATLAENNDQNYIFVRKALLK